MFTHLGNITTEEFLRDYWQKKPLLIRNAFPDFKSPLSADELAGLALDQDVESRIVMEDGPDGPWQLLQGPFEEDIFAQLPETHWTLLVQAVDQWVPQTQTILDQFRFLPSWRLDDLMVSYAPQGGSVGPHFDYYDVFLIQAQGQRRWQVGLKADAESPQVPGTSLRILDDFVVQHDWVLEPGDMLYLPPQYSHHGVALNDCLTYSVGFRAPSVAEIIDDLATDAISHYKDHQRYTDPQQVSFKAGEVSSDAIDQLHEIVEKALLDKQLLRNWLGRYMTTRKYPQLDIGGDANIEWLDALQQGATLQRHPASRFAFAKISDTEAELFVDGEGVKTELAVAQLLCGVQPLKFDKLKTHLNPQTTGILDQLVAYGALFIEQS